MIYVCLSCGHDLFKVYKIAQKVKYNALLEKRPVKQIKRVKITHSFLQSVSDQFYVIILSLLM